MEKFRLAVFNTQPPNLYFGGVERRIIETTKRLSSQADVTVYSGTKAGFKKPTVINGVTFTPCYSTDKLFPLDNWFFNRSLSKNKDIYNADVFEAHNVSGYGFPKTLKKLGIKKPFIHTIHGVLADEYEQARKSGYQSFRGRLANQFMHRLAKLEEETAKNATLIVTISKYSLEKMLKYYSVDQAKVRIVPNGVDTEKFKPEKDQATLKQRFGLDDKPCVLFVGSLIPRKGLSYLVEAAKKIVKEKAETKFLIVGDGPLRNQLVSSLESSDLSGNFSFLNHVKDTDMPALYNCADVFVLPSIQEGQGIVLLEAEASAKPVVAFNIGGVNEAVVNGETGLLAKPGSTDELAEALLKLLSDKPLREKMGANGRKFVTENFTWDLCVERMLAVYREALAT
jgi:glycosyltransferase involved in cell wall biosynthesis